jgi:hypothetical protein
MVKFDSDTETVNTVDAMSINERLSYLESSIDHLKQAKAEMSRAAGLVKNAGYNAMASHYKSLADDIDRRAQENLKEQEILQSNLTQTRLI